MTKKMTLDLLAKFQTAPEDAGQIVTKSWAICESCFILRIEDDSEPDFGPSYYRHEFATGWDDEFCIANGSPISQGAALQHGKHIREYIVADLLS